MAVGCTCQCCRHTYLLRGHHLSQTAGRKDKLFGKSSSSRGLFKVVACLLPGWGSPYPDSCHRHLPPHHCLCLFGRGLGHAGSCQANSSSLRKQTPQHCNFYVMCKKALAGKLKRHNRMQSQSVNYIARWRCLF